jgi:hypothetical protein
MTEQTEQEVEAVPCDHDGRRHDAACHYSPESGWVTIPAPVSSGEAATGEVHDCATCTDCVHDGKRCCGCYDGACCKSPDWSAAPEEAWDVSRANAWDEGYIAGADDARRARHLTYPEDYSPNPYRPAPVVTPSAEGSE